MKLRGIRRSFLAFAAAGAVATPCFEARAEEPTRVIQVDPDAYPPPSARVPLLVTGAAVTGVFYGAALGASYLWPDARGAEDLRIPIAGPWLKLFQTGCSETNPNCNKLLLAIGAVLVGIDGLGQAGGVGLMLEGIFMQTRHPTANGGVASWSASSGGWGWNRSATSADTSASMPQGPTLEPRPSVAWYPVPFTAGEDGLGFGVAGTF